MDGLYIYDECFIRQQILTAWRSMRSETNWDIEKDRLDLLEKMYHRINLWSGQHPDLLEIFQRWQIERLLLDSMNFCTVKDKYQGNQFIEFVVRSGYKNEPEDDVETGLPCLRRTTILHLVARKRVNHWRSLIKELFKIYDRFDLNYVDEQGFTHFHAACQADHRDLVVRFLELGRVDPNCRVRATGDSALHLAVANKHCHVVAKELLERGSCPNTANRRGETPLHAVCQRSSGSNRLAQTILICAQTPVRLDAQDIEWGRTPLHWLLIQGLRKTAELLMSRGADTLATDHMWLTPLHLICRGGYCDLLLLYIKMSSDQSVARLNVRDRGGNTPLHLALEQGHRTVALALLKNDADPNPVNARGVTPLRMIFERKKNTYDLAKTLYEVCTAMRRHPRCCFFLRLGSATAAELLVKSYANPSEPDRDDQSAATLQIILRKEASSSDDVIVIFFKIVDEHRDHQSSYLPVTTDLIDVIQAHGCDIASLNFPSSCYLELMFEALFNKNCSDFELRLAKGALSFIEQLCRRHACELDRNNATMLIRLFAEQGVLGTTSVGDRDHVDDDPWWNDEEFAEVARSIERTIVKETYSEPIDEHDEEAQILTTTNNLSLYELVKLPIDEAARLRLKPRDLLGFARSCRLRPTIGPMYTEACSRRLCIIMTRRFVRHWALDPFMGLTHYRLPLLCCELIMDLLNNHDLYNICLAATGCERAMPANSSLVSRWGFI